MPTSERSKGGRNNTKEDDPHPSRFIRLTARSLLDGKSPEPILKPVELPEVYRETGQGREAEVRCYVRVNGRLLAESKSGWPFAFVLGRTGLSRGIASWSWVSWPTAPEAGHSSSLPHCVDYGSLRIWFTDLQSERLWRDFNPHLNEKLVLQRNSKLKKIRTAMLCQFVKLTGKEIRSVFTVAFSKIVLSSYFLMEIKYARTNPVFMSSLKYCLYKEIINNSFIKLAFWCTT